MHEPQIITWITKTPLKIPPCTGLWKLLVRYENSRTPHWNKAVYINRKKIVEKITVTYTVTLKLLFGLVGAIFCWTERALCIGLGGSLWQGQLQVLDTLWYWTDLSKSWYFFALTYNPFCVSCQPLVNVIWSWNVQNTGYLMKRIAIEIKSYAIKT